MSCLHHVDCPNFLHYSQNCENINCHFRLETDSILQYCFLSNLDQMEVLEWCSTNLPLQYFAIFCAFAGEFVASCFNTSAMSLRPVQHIRKGSRDVVESLSVK